MLSAASAVSTFDSELLGWLCFIAGVVVLAVGASIGVRQGSADAKTAKANAKSKLDEAKNHLDAAKTQVAMAKDAPPDSPAAANAGAAANTAADNAKSALQQAADIISALPENLRFAGLLVLVGTILIGVATIQFGGTSIF